MYKYLPQAISPIAMVDKPHSDCTGTPSPIGSLAEDDIVDEVVRVVAGQCLSEHMLGQFAPLPGPSGWFSRYVSIKEGDRVRIAHTLQSGGRTDMLHSIHVAQSSTMPGPCAESRRSRSKGTLLLSISHHEVYIATPVPLPR
jgi:hypothetical protein